MVILGPEEENWAWMKWQNAYQINYLLGSFSCHRCHAERLICTNLKEGEGESSEWAAIHYMWCGNGFKFHALPMSMSYQPTDRAYHSQWYWLFSFSWNELAHYSLAHRLCDHRRAHCSPNWIYCFHLPGTLSGMRVCVFVCSCFDWTLSVSCIFDLFMCHFV